MLLVRIYRILNYRTYLVYSEPAEFEWKVLRTFRDPLSRQTAEAVSIRRHQGELLNSKAEFHQPPLLQVRSKVVRGIA